MHFTIFLAATILGAQGLPPYKCGDETVVPRPYGKVRRIVECRDWDLNRISVLEKKGNLLHGMGLTFDTLWTRLDSINYRNNKREGDAVSFDSLGKEIGRTHYKNDVPFGKEDFHYSPGRPMFIKHYDAKGEVHGPWLEWWPNGNKRKELEMNHGMLKHSMEWFPDGKPRQSYTVHYRKATGATMHRRISSKENWAFDGRPAGKVVNGVGEVLIFQLDEENRRMEGVIHEVYRDSVVKEVDVLDTAQAYRRLDSLARKK